MHPPDNLNMPFGDDPRDAEIGVFRLKTRRDDMSLGIQVEGRLDGRSGDHLFDVVQQLTSEGDTVTIGLSAVTDMDADGAEAVSRTAGAIASLGSTMALEVGDTSFLSLLEPYGLSPLSGGAGARSQKGAIDRRRPG